MKLFWKIFIAVLTVFVVVVSLISYVVTVKQISDSEHRIIEEHRSIGRFLSKNLEVGLLESRWPFEILKELSEYEHFLFWWVVRDDGTIHLADDASFMETDAHDYFRQVAKEIKDEIVLLDYNQGYGILVKPLGTGHQDWSFWLGFSLSEISEARKDIVLLAIILLLIALIGLGVILFFLIKHFTKPIVDLKESADKISKGDLDERIEVKSRDEVGELGEAFNKMVESLIELEVVEKEKEKIKAILQSIGEGVFMVNKKLQIMMFNPAAAEISGFSVKEAVGKRYDKVLKFVYEESGKTNDKFIKKCLKTGEPQAMSNHTVLIKKDGSKLAVADTAAPIIGKNKKIIGAVVVFRDIAKEREVDRMKTEFISLASHQLRTPLSAMRWFGEMLLNGDAGKLSKEQEEFIQNIYQSNLRMIALVGALLNISRIESGRIIIDPKPTDLGKLIQGVLDELKIELKERKQKLVFSVHGHLPKVKIDPKLVRHVYLNLLTNAIKYTLEKGEISVFVSKKGDEIVSQISDTGLGIPKKEQDKVFQKFFRGENIVKLETKGTGLGLYLAKAVVESSGGKIWFESEEKKGTTFWFTLPVSGSPFKKGEVSLDS